MSAIAESKKGNVQRQVVNEVLSNADIDIDSVIDAQGVGLNVQVWIYKLTTPSLADLHMSSDTSIAMAAIANVG